MKQTINLLMLLRT